MLPASYNVDDQTMQDYAPIQKIQSTRTNPMQRCQFPCSVQGCTKVAELQLRVRIHFLGPSEECYVVAFLGTSLTEISRIKLYSKVNDFTYTKFMLLIKYYLKTKLPPRVRGQNLMRTDPMTNFFKQA